MVLVIDSLDEPFHNSRLCGWIPNQALTSTSSKYGSEYSYLQNVQKDGCLWLVGVCGIL